MDISPCTRRLRQTTAAVVLSVGLAIGMASCGFDDQTLQPYTQAEGVNTDIGKDPNTSAALVKVRNLLIISKANGTGFISAQLTSPKGDALTSVTGTTLTSDGSQSGKVAAELKLPVAFGPSNAIQLSTHSPAIMVNGNGLVAGRTAKLTLTFREAGEITVQVPVVDGNKADYASSKPAKP